MGRPSLTGLCFELTETSVQALRLRAKAERWIAIAERRIDPDPDEILPREVWHAREQRARPQG